MKNISLNKFLLIWNHKFCLMKLEKALFDMLN